MPVVLVREDAARSTPRVYKTPNKGPTDAKLYLVCGAIMGADRAVIANDVVWLVDESELTRGEITLDEIDELEAMGWLDLSRSVEAIDVTERGKHWVSRFLKANDDKFGSRRTRGWSKFLKRTFGN